MRAGADWPRRGRGSGDRGQAGFRLSAEDRLLLACSRVNLDPPNRELIMELLGADVNWGQLLTKATRHGVPTLVYHHLRSLGASGAVPGQAWDTLERAYRAAQLLAMRQRYEVGRLLDALGVANVRVIVLKGLALVETIYPDPALRPSGDIDLLVCLADIDDVEATLRRLGYLPGEEFQPREWYRPGVFHHLCPYRLPGREVQVDAHWGLLPPRVGVSADVEGLWARATMSSIAGRPVWVLAPADLVLHLSLHVTAQHRLQTGLRHLVDVAEACRHYGAQLEWGAVVARAASWRARRYAYLSLRLARDLLGAPVSDEVLEQLRPDAVGEQVVTSARVRLLTARPAGERLPVSVNLGRLLLPSGGGDRLRLFVARLFPTPEWMVGEYGLPPQSPAVYGYYLLRPFELLGRYVPLLMGAALGGRRGRTEIEVREQDIFLEDWFESAPLEGCPPGK